MTIVSLHASPSKRRRSALGWAAPLVLLLLTPLGCAKMSAQDRTAYPQEMAASGGYAGMPAPAPAADPSFGYDGAQREFAMDAEADYRGLEESKVAAIPPTTTVDYMTEAPAKPGGKAGADTKPASTPTSDTGTVTGGEGTDKKDDDQPDHGRQIIYTATLQVGVYNLADAMKTAEALPERYGGWVHMRTEGQVVMRIPADGLRNMMDELGKLGVVQSRTLQAQDVTAEYVDLESRIKVLLETQAQLLALLDKAKTVEEALHVRKALDDVTMELEVALGRMRQLSNLIAFSTLTLYLYELGPTQPIPSSNDPFPWVNELGVETTEWR